MLGKYFLFSRKNTVPKSKRSPQPGDKELVKRLVRICRLAVAALQPEVSSWAPVPKRPSSSTPSPSSSGGSEKDQDRDKGQGEEIEL